MRPKEITKGNIHYTQLDENELCYISVPYMSRINCPENTHVRIYICTLLEREVPAGVVHDRGMVSWFIQLPAPLVNPGNRWESDQIWDHEENAAVVNAISTQLHNAYSGMQSLIDAVNKLSVVGLDPAPDATDLRGILFLEALGYGATEHLIRGLPR